ncbi:MAG: hypothetical protein ACYC5Q_01060 [Thermoleophilia bacterium]
MKRSTSGIIMIVGLAALVAVAWIYLQDRQQATSSATPSSNAVGQSGSAGSSASTGASPAAQQSTPNFVAADDGAGGVKVSAATLTPGAVKEDPTLGDMAALFDPATELGFLVMFETHSGDLSQLDLVALSDLKGPDGDHKAVRWVSESDSGHHRSGMLVFERGGLDLAGAGDLTLTVKDVAGVPTRTLTWLLPLQ